MNIEALNLIFLFTLIILPRLERLVIFPKARREGGDSQAFPSGISEKKNLIVWIPFYAMYVQVSHELECDDGSGLVEK